MENKLTYTETITSYCNASGIAVDKSTRSIAGTTDEYRKEKIGPYRYRCPVHFYGSATRVTYECPAQQDQVELRLSVDALQIP